MFEVGFSELLLIMGLALLVLGPLRLLDNIGGGLLGGVLRKQKEGRSAGPMAEAGLARYGDQIAAYEALCDELGEQPADVGLAWLLQLTAELRAWPDPDAERWAETLRPLESEAVMAD